MIQNVWKFPEFMLGIQSLREIERLKIETLEIETLQNDFRRENLNDDVR